MVVASMRAGPATWRAPDGGGTPLGHVVLIHGILAGPWQMRKLARWLGSEGYATVAVGYRSHTGDVEGMVDDVVRDVPPLPRDATLHAVAFSLGGVVARAWLARERPEGFGRLVTLGSPHGGQELADLEQRLGIGRLGAPVTTSARRAHDEAHPPHYEFGTVAAAMLPGVLPHDGFISVRSTRSPFEREHLVVRGIHHTLVASPAVADLAAAFLRDGRFGTAAAR